MKYSTTTVECRSPSVIVDNLNNDEDFLYYTKFKPAAIDQLVNLKILINILNIFDVIIMIELLNNKMYQ
jgi:hypothetical protein